MRACLASHGIAAVAASLGFGTLAAADVPYVLQPTSIFQDGCFPPCQCPLIVAPLTGTFTFQQMEENPLFVTYAVQSVDVSAQIGPTKKSIQGSGTYVIGGEVAYVQRMQLDLSINGQAPQHYDSGWISVLAAFPAIHVQVSRNGLFCLDTALDIFAAPSQASPADLDGDGMVNGSDLSILLGTWGLCRTVNCIADLNGDGKVNAADLSILLGAWTV